jgi:uncharacterized protein (TIGR02117 family)
MVSRVLKPLCIAAAATAIAIAAFLLIAWIGSSLPRNDGWKQPDRGVTIMVETNGVHTAIVMPLVTPIKDWRTDFPASDLADPATPYTHVSVSWGEREVFLETPTWADLSPITVLRILILGGDGVLHVAHYVRPAPADDIRPLWISEAQYERLVRRIEASVLPAPRRSHPGYGSYDVFYETNGRYTFTNTCNQWTSDTLASAGIRTGWWTPFAGGVMKWVPFTKANRPN